MYKAHDTNRKMWCIYVCNPRPLYCSSRSIIIIMCVLLPSPVISKALPYLTPSTVRHLNGRQCPQSCGLVSRRGQERKVCRMPASRNRLVRMLCHNHRGQGHRQVSLQIRQHQFVVVTSRQQIICRRREPYRPEREIVSPVTQSSLIIIP